MEYYFNPNTAHHFPDMLAGWPQHHNDNFNTKGEAMVEHKNKTPFELLLDSQVATNETIKHLTECIKMHHAVLADHENRIQTIEEEMDEVRGILGI